MTPLAIFGILLIVIVASCASWIAGYSRAWARAELFETQCRELVKSKAALARWVRENWPDEFTAYRDGVLAGYAQGVSEPGNADDWPTP